MIAHDSCVASEFLVKAMEARGKVNEGIGPKYTAGESPQGIYDEITATDVHSFVREDECLFFRRVPRVKIARHNDFRSHEADHDGTSR